MKAVCHNLLAFSPSLRYATNRGGEGTIPEIPFYLSENNESLLNRFKGLEEQIKAAKDSMAIPGVIITKADAEFLLQFAAKGLAQHKVSADAKAARIAAEHENRDAKKWKKSIRQVDESSSSEEDDA